MTEHNDGDRADFLAALDKASVTPTPWEISFLSSAITSGRRSFSVKQRAVIDKMIDNYGSEVEW